MNIERFKYFGEVNKYTQELPYRNNFDINLIIYLSYKIGHQKLKAIQETVLEWPKISPHIQKFSQYTQLIASLST